MLIPRREIISWTLFWAAMLRGDTRSLSDALHARIRGSQYQHSSCIKIGNCTPYWSTYYMCSFFYGCLVVTFLLMRKQLVSNVDMWIIWEYPTQIRETDIRWMLSETEDILTFFPWGIKAWQSNTHIWEFHLGMLMYFIYFQHLVINS